MPIPTPDPSVDVAKMSPSAVIPAMDIAIIGGTGDGGSPITTGATAVTPDHLPNLAITVVTPLMAIFVRFANLFLTTLVGIVVAGMTPVGGKLLYTSDFVHLVLLSASLALPGAAIGFVKDLITILGRLEGRWPLATGSI